MPFVAMGKIGGSFRNECNNKLNSAPFPFTVNVDEWMKSANLLSPNDVETGGIVAFQLLTIDPH